MRQDDDKLMNLTKEEFDQFLSFDEEKKWKTIWDALRLLETYAYNTDGTLVNLCKDYHEFKESLKE